MVRRDWTLDTIRGQKCAVEYKSQIIFALTSRIRKFSLSNLSVLNETVLDLSNNANSKTFFQGGGPHI